MFTSHKSHVYTWSLLFSFFVNLNKDEMQTVSRHVSSANKAVVLLPLFVLIYYKQSSLKESKSKTVRVIYSESCILVTDNFVPMTEKVKNRACNGFSRFGNVLYGWQVTGSRRCTPLTSTLHVS